MYKNIERIGKEPISPRECPFCGSTEAYVIPHVEDVLHARLEAAEDYIAVLDADGQDPPALIPEMLKIVSSGEYDCVGTRRVTRKGEPPVRSFFARRFYALMKHITDIDIVDGARDFRLMNRKYTAKDGKQT